MLRRLFLVLLATFLFVAASATTAFAHEPQGLLPGIAVEAHTRSAGPGEYLFSLDIRDAATDLTLASPSLLLKANERGELSATDEVTGVHISLCAQVRPKDGSVWYSVVYQRTKERPFSFKETTTLSLRP